MTVGSYGQVVSPMIYGARGNAQLLLDTLSFNSQIDVISSTVDPTSVATPGEPGSVLLSSNGKAYIKQDSGTTTNWDEFATSVELQSPTGVFFGSALGLPTTDALDFNYNSSTNEMSLNGKFDTIQVESDSFVSRVFTGIRQLFSDGQTIGEATEVGVGNYYSAGMTETSLEENDGVSIDKKSGQVFFAAHNNNIVPNYSFELATGASPDGGWNGTAGDTIVAHSNPQDGDSQFLNVEFVGSQIYESSPVGFPSNQEFSGGCIAYVQYKGGDSNVTLKIQSATPTGSYKTLGQTILPDTPVVSNSVAMAFDCPAPGDTGKIVVESSATASMEFYKAFIQPDDRVSVTKESAYMVGSVEWAETAGCAFGNTSSSYVNFPADAICDNNERIIIGQNNITNGDVGNSDGQQPLIKLQNLKPGNYVFNVEGHFQTNNVSNKCYWRVSDGTYSGVANEGGSSTADVLDGNITNNIRIDKFIDETTFHLQGASGNGGVCRVQLSTAGGSITRGLKISVFYYPDERDAVQFDPIADNFIVDAVITKGSGSGYSDVTVGTGLLHSHANTVSYISPTGSNNATLFQTCNAASAVKLLDGTTTCAGNVNLGFGASFRRSGKFEVCYAVPIGCNQGGSASGEMNYFIQKTNEDGSTVLQTGGSRVGVKQSASSGAYNSADEPVCNIFDIDQVGNHFFRMYHDRAQSGGNACGVRLSGGSGANLDTYTGRITVRPIQTESQMPRKILGLPGTYQIIWGGSGSRGTCVQADGTCTTLKETGPVPNWVDEDEFGGADVDVGSDGDFALITKPGFCNPGEWVACIASGTANSGHATVGYNSVSNANGLSSFQCDSQGRLDFRNGGSFGIIFRTTGGSSRQAVVGQLTCFK